MNLAGLESRETGCGCEGTSQSEIRWITGAVLTGVAAATK